MSEETVPLASAAAFNPDARPRQSAPLLDLSDGAGVPAVQSEDVPFEAKSEEVPAPRAGGPLDRLGSLRDIARKLRQAPDAQQTLQYVIDTACECTGADAGMLTVNAPDPRQVVTGQALGAGPYISVQLRVNGPTFGEIVLTRMSEAEDFASEDETFADLVAEYVAKAVSGLRRGTVLSDDEQDFVYRIVDELRAPLASAVNVLGMVLGGEGGTLSDAQRTYLAGVSRDGSRMLRLIDDLATISHLRPPELREMHRMPVAPWLRAGVERAAEAAKERGVELVFTEPSSPYVVMGVPAQLELVIDHVIDNALKFSESGGSVEVRAGEAEGLLRVDVIDQGIGFDSADATRMLDCYARATNAEAARIPGAGIGLFLASQIVSNHRGRVWLETRRDEGTQAYVSLPLSE
jgi:signal transduction histidine kinase